VLSSASDEKRSLEGIDVSGLQDRATCYVREFLATYRYFDGAADAPVFPFIVAPTVGQGRWRLVATDLILVGWTRDYVDAGIEDLTGNSSQALGAAGSWVTLDTPTWISNQQGFQMTANGKWEYQSALPRQFLLSAKVSLRTNTALSVSIGVGVGLPDPHPQTYRIPAGGVTTQIATDRVEILQSVASGGALGKVELRSNSAGNEVVTVISAQMVITPA
jgi:hypothetical protein